MTRKLFALAKGDCAIESPDNPMNQEVLLAGHLYLMVLKEKLMTFLYSVRANIEKKAKPQGASFKLTTGGYAPYCFHSSHKT